MMRRQGLGAPMREAPQRASKPRVTIYITAGARSTEHLTKHIGQYIDLINKSLFLNIVKVTERNSSDVHRMGITKTPTLVYNGKHIVTLDKIIRMLTPPSQAKDRYGVDNTNPDELTRRYFDSVIDTGDDNIDDADNTEEDIRRRMAAIQKRRPEMKGVGEKQMIRGGRKVKAGRQMDTAFSNDDDFIKNSGRAEQQLTPSKSYMTEMDGDMILENYYNDLADASGRKPSSKPRRRPQMN